MKFVSLLLVLLGCSQAAACPYGELRLIFNRTDQSHSAGNVEVCYSNNQWEPILDNQWDDQDAKVACNQLGFANEGATAYHNESAVYGHLKDFNCSGSESNLINCHFGQNNNRSGNYAGIKCLLHKPCQPQISPNPYHTSNYVSFSWTGCSRDKVAPALDYLVSCADYLQIQRSTSKTVYGLRPNKWYSCSVYGIDTLGRLGGYASFSFRTSKIAPQFAPYDFNFAFMSSTSISLTWEPPPVDDRIGTITQYRIQYRCQSYYTCSQTRINYRSAQQSLTYAVNNLQSGEEYTFNIAACVGSQCGHTTSGLTVNVPPIVPGFAARSITASTVRLSWRRPNRAIKYYIIEATDRDTSISETHYIANPATTSIDIHSLHPYHFYEFSIAAFTAAKGPLESRRIQMPQAVPTGGPQIVNCEVLNLTALGMNWNEPHHLDQNGPIEHYWIYVWNKDTDELVYNTILMSPSDIQVPSLDPYHNYNCSIAAFARGGLGPFTTANVWLTDEADASAPINLKPLEIGSEFFHLNWLEPHTRNQNTTVQHYKIAVYSTENQTAEFPVQYVQVTSYNMTSLHPNYHYTITVEAVTVNTIGPSASINIQTEEDIPSEAPQNLRSTKVTTNSVILKWEAPPLPSQNGAIIGYAILVSREDNTTSFIPTLSSGETILTVTNLDDDTPYNFSVAAKTNIGAGPYSIHITAKTKNYALEVAMYSLIGGCLLLVLMVIVGSCVVYCCCRSKLKQCTSKRLTKGSKGSTNVTSLEQDSGNDYNLRRSATRDGKQQTPELPDREYLEDIDFVSKEFDLFFKRQPDLPTRMDDNLNGDNKNEAEEKEGSCSEEEPATMEKHAAEASHYMSLKDTQEGGQNSVSVYESLKPRKQEPTVYEDVKLKEESSARSHYQPLVLAKRVQENKNDSSHYQSLNISAKLT